MEILFYILISLVVGSLIWRTLTHFYNIPWPYFLAFWLENPYMKLFANPNALIKECSIKRGDRILEIGCGAGRVLIRAGKAAELSGEFVGVDMQKNMIRQAQKAVERAAGNKGPFKLIHAKFSPNFATTHNLETNSFDKILLVTVLGEIPNKQIVLSTAYSLLKPDGSLIIQEVIPDPCYITKHRLKQLCESAGFLSDRKIHSFLNYIYIFKK